MEGRGRNLRRPKAELGMKGFERVKERDLMKGRF